MSSPIGFEPELPTEPTPTPRDVQRTNLFMTARAEAGVIVLHQAAEKARELGLFADQNEAVVEYLRACAAAVQAEFDLGGRR